MFLVYLFFATNVFLTLKILYNLNTKFKGDKEAWEGAGFFLTLTLLFGTILWIRDLFSGVKNGDNQ